MALATTDAKRPRRCPDPSMRICWGYRNRHALQLLTAGYKMTTHLLKSHLDWKNVVGKGGTCVAWAEAHAYSKTRWATMAAKERSGPAKRRSWGKCRQKEKVLCIDHMDVAELTKTNKSTYNRSRSEDLQHPELMSNQTIVDHLSEMKIVITDRELSRERLFYLFRKHVSPKPQRSSFWRRRRGVKNEVPMVVDYNHETWISSSKSWDSTQLRKRWSHSVIMYLSNV